MKITTTGIVLYVRPHGESTAIVSVFTPDMGRVKGLVKGARKKADILQPGNTVEVTWARRLESQLGTFYVDCERPVTSKYFDDYTRLSCLQYVGELLENTLPDEHPYPELFDVVDRFIHNMPNDKLWANIGLLELEVLKAIGFGLSLEKEEAVPCPEDSELFYVSPKSGRAVSRHMGAPYKDKLFLLPHLFGGPKRPKSKDFLDVFTLTGHFLHQAVYGKPLIARKKLIELGIESNFNDQ